MKLNADLLGWSLAALLAGVFVAAGFQAPADKTAVVDLDKVSQASTLYKTKRDAWLAQVQNVQAFMDFIDANRIIAPEQFDKLHDLWLKDAPTDADKTNLASLKSELTDNTKSYQTLSAQTNRTPDEQSRLEEFTRRGQKITAALPQLQQEFSGEADQAHQTWIFQVQDAARLAAQAVGKDQGYTLVFSAGAAAYGSNDITDAVVAKMNKP